MHLPPDLSSEYNREIADKALIAVRVLNLLAIVLFPAFAALDSLLYPDALPEILRIRVAVVILLCLNYALLTILARRGLGQRWSLWLSLGVFTPPLLGLDWIMLRQEGAASPYYAGVCLVLIALLVSLPWSFGTMTISAMAIWLQYLLAMLLFDPAIREHWRQFVSNNFFLVSTLVIGLTWTFTGHRLRVAEFLNRKQLAAEKEKSDWLLRNILPDDVAEELKQHARVEPRRHARVAILFTDIVGFTALATEMRPERLLRMLDTLFTDFDHIVARHSLERLKTIGDSYMCAAGLTGSAPHPLLDCMLAGLEMIGAVRRFSEQPEHESIEIRIGIHEGPVLAGVIGRQKFAYDIWGDTVNTASRLEHASDPGKINVAREAAGQYRQFFVTQDRGELQVKGKGAIAMMFVERLQPDYALDAHGWEANAELSRAARAERLEIPRVCST